MSKIAKVLGALLVVKGVQINPLVTWMAAESALPSFNGAGLTVCTKDTLDWDKGFGGDGETIENPMHVVLVSDDDINDKDPCSKNLMVRVTKNGGEDMHTQHLYIRIAGFVSVTDAAGPAANDILLPDLSTFKGAVIDGPVTTYLCSKTCESAVFELKDAALPVGLGFNVGTDGTDCIDGEKSTHPDVKPVIAAELKALSTFADAEIKDACYEYFELKREGTTTPTIVTQIQKRVTLGTSVPASPYTFTLTDAEMKTLCGTAAVVEHTDRVPFQCLITSKATTAPEEEETTTTTTTEEATTTTTTLEDTTTTTTKGEATTDDDDEHTCFLLASAFDACTKRNLEYTQEKLKDVMPEEVMTICSYWPTVTNCGTEDDPCPLLLDQQTPREGSSPEVGQCGDVYKFSVDGRSIYGQLVAFGVQASSEKPHFNIPGRAWETICPYSCIKSTYPIDNCFATASDCSEFGGAHTETIDGCACNKESCIDDLIDAIKPKDPFVVNPFLIPEEADLSCKDTVCCEKCIEMPAAANYSVIRDADFEWTRKETGSNAFKVGAAVAASLCGL